VRGGQSDAQTRTSREPHIGVVGGEQARHGKVGAAAFYHHRDHLKSIRVITNAAGLEASRTVYRAFGDKAVETGTDIEPRGYMADCAVAQRRTPRF
jgi:hypothetical protein